MTLWQQGSTLCLESTLLRAVKSSICRADLVLGDGLLQLLWPWHLVYQEYMLTRLMTIVGYWLARIPVIRAIPGKKV